MNDAGPDATADVHDSGNTFPETSVADSFVAWCEAGPPEFITIVPFSCNDMLYVPCGLPTDDYINEAGLNANQLNRCDQVCEGWEETSCEVMTYGQVALIFALLDGGADSAVDASDAGAADAVADANDPLTRSRRWIRRFTCRAIARAAVVAPRACTRVVEDAVRRWGSISRAWRTSKRLRFRRSCACTPSSPRSARRARCSAASRGRSETNSVTRESLARWHDASVASSRRHASSVVAMLGGWRRSRARTSSKVVCARRMARSSRRGKPPTRRTPAFDER